MLEHAVVNLEKLNPKMGAKHALATSLVPRWQGLGMRLADNHSVKWGNGNLGIGFCLTTLEKKTRSLSKTVRQNLEWKSLRFEGQGDALFFPSVSQSMPCG